MTEIWAKFVDKRSEHIYPIDVIAVVIILAKLLGRNTANEIALFYKEFNLELQFLIPGMPSPRHKLSPTTVNTVMLIMTLEDIQHLMETYFGGVAVKLAALCECDMQRKRSEHVDKHTLMGRRA